METEPRKLSPIKNGWAAFGKGWAVHGRTREEAIRLFQEPGRRHEYIDARPQWEAAANYEQGSVEQSSRRLL